MPLHVLTLPDAPKAIRPGALDLGGANPAGERVGVNGFHLTWNGRPWFPVTGEVHFSRIPAAWWDDELAKVKAAGVDVVATYVFWNHHEEEEGRFDWSGERDLRGFVEACARAGLWVIVRIGPWCHGEARNGGFPDWLYGQPFDVRSDDPAYLALVARWYGEIGRQLQGLLFRDGGPVIGTQLENELQHSSAPWEPTAGTSAEWVPGGGSDPAAGEAHVRTLKRLAREAGIETPLYTCTAWGGGAAPLPDVLPLWGGYAYQPWLFFQPWLASGGVREHPATPEYLFRDHHDDATPRTYNFEPRYRPEDVPYACCELMGGMQVYYAYRFQLPPEAVEALGIVKVAGGCNLLGWYMFHGGTHPEGRRTPFLNENVTPKRSYDYQAPVGEAGQLHGQYGRLKALHGLLRAFGDRLCGMRTVLPPGASDLDPRDTSSLRWAVRARGGSGFLFLNAFQDHAELRDHPDLAFELSAGGEVLRVPQEGGFALGAGVSCVLPFGFDLDGVVLRYALGQPLGRFGERFLFFTPEGMHGEYVFDDAVARAVRCEGGAVDRVATGAGRALAWRVRTGAGVARITVIAQGGAARELWVLPREQALQLFQARCAGAERLVVVRAAVLGERAPGAGCRIECEGTGPFELRVAPPLPPDVRVRGGTLTRVGDDGPFAVYRLELPPLAPRMEVRRAGPRRAALAFTPAAFEGVKRLLLRVRYAGDVGSAFLRGRLVADDFSNGAPWDVELTRHAAALVEHGLALHVAPRRAGGRVVVTAMAGQAAVADEEVGSLDALELVPVRDVVLG